MPIPYVYILGSVLIGVFLLYLIIFLAGRRGGKEVYPFASGEKYGPVRIPYRVSFIYYVALFAAFETLAVMVMLAFIARIMLFLIVYLILAMLALFMAPKVIKE